MHPVVETNKNKSDVKEEETIKIHTTILKREISIVGNYAFHLFVGPLNEKKVV
jgi:hypothetical protein